MSYTSRSIRVLKGLEACRTRPGMYIGNTQDGSGLHHMIYEVLDNSIDEHLAQHCSEIHITLDEEGYACISDNGRGIPVDIHETEGISAAIVIMTQLHAGGKFDQDSYKISGGLHGVGVSVVNALSEKLELTIHRDGSKYFALFGRGDVIEDLKRVGDSNLTGTTVRFLPDKKIFNDITFDIKIIETRIEELSYLNSGLKITLEDKRINYKREFYQPDGFTAFIKNLVGSKELLHDIIHFSYEKDNVKIEGATVWVKNYYAEEVRCFTNTIPQKDGGTHLVGLRTAFTRCVNAYIQKVGSFTKKMKEVNLTGEDIREGIVCVLAVYTPEPQFASQTKEKLVSAHVRPIVEAGVSQALEAWFEENPNEAKQVIQKIVEAAMAREAARKSRDLVRNKGVTEFNLSMASKLAGCTQKDPTKAELFIVEGDSAGGTAKMGRNRLYQAVLPLRGKILNVEKASLNRMLSDEGIRTLIAVMGTGIGETFDITKIRYNKIIIMTDADVDGSHILTLLITFFFKYMRPVIENGYLYVAQPPLYGVKQGQNTTYLLDDEALATFLLERNLNKINFTLDNGREQYIDKDEIKAFIKHLFNISPDIKARGLIFEAFISEGMMEFENIEQLYDKLLHRLKKIQPGKWSWKFNDNQFNNNQLNNNQIDNNINSHEKTRAEKIASSPIASIPNSKLEEHEISLFDIDDNSFDENNQGLNSENTQKNDTKNNEEENSVINDCTFSYEKNGLIYRYPFSFSKVLDKHKVFIKKWKYMWAEDMKIIYGSETYQVNSPMEIYELVNQKGMHDLQVQRYKGLGEMNADDLAKTAMQSYLQVRYEDEAEAEQLVAKLMGDDVEPRKIFIEEMEPLLETDD